MSDLEKQIVENSKQKEIAVGGEFAYAYFVEQYDLKFVSVYTNCGHGKDPSIAKVKSVIDYIYSEEFFNQIESQYKNSYYSVIEEPFSKCYAETTNYTPFLSFSKFNTVYLAGKLSQFEVPDELRVFDLVETDVTKSMIFPYMIY